MRVYRRRGQYGWVIQTAGVRPIVSPQRQLRQGRVPMPAHKVRAKYVTICITAADREFLDGASRRLGVTIGRAVGNAIEEAIRRKIFDELAERRR